MPIPGPAFTLGSDRGGSEARQIKKLPSVCGVWTGDGQFSIGGWWFTDGGWWVTTNMMMMNIFGLTAGGRGKHRGLSISPNLAFLTSFVVLSLFSCKAAPNWLLNIFFAKTHAAQ